MLFTNGTLGDDAAVENLEESGVSAEEYRSKETMIRGKCKPCAWVSTCGGGCEVRAYKVCDNIPRPDPLCWVEP